jgi:hypothetical protein
LGLVISPRTPFAGLDCTEERFEFSEIATVAGVNALCLDTVSLRADCAKGGLDGG